MNKGEEKKIHEILESGSIGYAYLFDAKARKTLEKVVSLEPENLAALFRKYGTEMEWMSVTDMRDRMVLLEQIRVLDKSRLGEYIGHLEAGRMKDVEYAMAVSLGLFDDSGIEEEFGREQVEYEQFLHM